jgi:predicted acylesterase/phospholipase RssA
MPRGKFLRIAPRLTPPSFLSMDSIRKFLTTFVDEERCRRAKRCWLYVVATDILNDGLHQATYAPVDGGPWDAPLLDHILGSIAIPFVMPPVEVLPKTPGAPRRILCDGHIVSFASLLPLAQRGALDFLFLGVAGPSRHETKHAGIAGMIHIMIHQLLRAQVSNALQAVSHDAHRLGLRFFEFNPQRPMDMSVLGFKKEECRKGFDWGVEDAQKFLAAPDRFRIGADLVQPTS